MLMKGNAIAIGNASTDLVMYFPWLIQGFSSSLEDYSWEDLTPFRLIYLIEPDIKDLRRFEKRVVELVDSGKVVIIIELGKAGGLPVMGIVPYRESISQGSLFAHAPKSPFANSFSLESIEGQEIVAIGNLDEVWFE